MFGLKYEYAELIVGVVMLAYVLFGQDARDDLGRDHQGRPAPVRPTPHDPRAREVRLQPGNLYAAVVAKYGQVALELGGIVAGLEAISLGLAPVRLLGLLHILMRFYTVPDAKAARKSVLYATGLIGYFYIIIRSSGSARRSSRRAATFILSIDKGGNMAAPLLAELLGGTAFLGFIAAVAFATILAVVAGPRSPARPPTRTTST